MLTACTQDVRAMVRRAALAQGRGHGAAEAQDLAAAAAHSPAAGAVAVQPPAGGGGTETGW